LLGRPPRGEFEVVVKDALGRPVVIRNAPFLDDGTPMPTLYWLVDRQACQAVARLEAAGGVRQAQREVDPEELERAHLSYARLRDSRVPAGWVGPRPRGGVGGARAGVKCLHAHYAYYLAGGADPVGAWVAGKLADMASSSNLAAIDCGTNSTRLLVTTGEGTILESANTITRLGQGVDSTRRLAPEAIERTLQTLRRYREILDSHRVARVRMTATSAARDATNSEEFFSAAEELVGVRPELLSGQEEARLSYLGATRDLDGGAPWLVVDIGGGSTELAVGPAPDRGPLVARSLDVGCVRLSERFLCDDPPRPEQLESARAYVRELLDSTLKELPELRSARTMIGLAGTVSCLSALDQKVDVRDRAVLHHHLLSASRVRQLLDQLAALDSAGRRRLASMEPARADVIVAGTLVLDEVMGAFGFESCLTSEADILDGLIMSLQSDGVPGGPGE